MSIYDVSKRFEKELLLAPDNLLISFPLFTKNDEMIFFYQLKKTKDNKIMLENIDKVVYRNRITDERKVVQFQELEPDNKNSLGFDIPIESEQKDDFWHLDKRYYDLHEHLMDISLSTPLTENHRTLLVEYIQCFNTLVPDGSLRNVYHYLAKDFFLYLNQHGIT